MKLPKRIFSFLFLVGLVVSALAEEPFNGLVLDREMKPKKGVKVYVKDPKRYATTDKKGRFGLTDGSRSTRYDTSYSYDSMGISSITYNVGNPVYNAYLTDHQGNIRMVVSESAAVRQVVNYYPYGALMAAGPRVYVHRYMYNGKELDRMHGLDWYDYGARHYDAAIGRRHLSPGSERSVIPKERQGYHPHQCRTQGEIVER